MNIRLHAIRIGAGLKSDTIGKSGIRARRCVHAHRRRVYAHRRVCVSHMHERRETLTHVLRRSQAGASRSRMRGRVRSRSSICRRPRERVRARRRVNTHRRFTVDVTCEASFTVNVIRSVSHVFFCLDIFGTRVQNSVFLRYNLDVYYTVLSRQIKSDTTLQ